MSVACCGDNILFVAVARCSDGTVVGTWTAKSVEHNGTQYLQAIREVCNAPDFGSKVAVGQKVRFTTSSHGALSLMRDEARTYLTITTSEYSERLVFPFLDQVKTSLNANNSAVVKSNTCKECGLNKKLKSIVKPLVEEYDDPSKKDKLSAVQQKVDSVKLQMHNNIEGMLANVDKTEQLEKDAADLEQGANVFNKNANSLKKREQWKSKKLTIIIALIVLIILAVLCFYLARQFK